MKGLLYLLILYFNLHFNLVTAIGILLLMFLIQYLFSK